MTFYFLSGKHLENQFLQNYVIKLKNWSVGEYVDCSVAVIFYVASVPYV